jgi:hypothetical protein
MVIKPARGKYLEETIEVASNLEAVCFFQSLKLRPDEPAIILDQSTGIAVIVIPSTIIYLKGERLSPDLAELKPIQGSEVKPDVMDITKPQLFPRIMPPKYVGDRPAKGTPEFYQQTARFFIKCPECGGFKYGRLWRDSESCRCGNCGNDIDLTQFQFAKAVCSCCNNKAEMYVPNGTKEIDCGSCGAPIDLVPDDKDPNF